MARSKKQKNLKTENLKKGLLWVGGIIVTIITLTNLALWGRNGLATWQREPIEKEIKEWEEIVEKTPTYRDGYLKLATLYWQLRQDDKAKAALERVKEIDPNYGATYELEEKLGY